jgi:hypothetical protein
VSIRGQAHFGAPRTFKPTANYLAEQWTAGKYRIAGQNFSFSFKMVVRKNGIPQESEVGEELRKRLE